MMLLVLEGGQLPPNCTGRGSLCARLPRPKHAGRDHHVKYFDRSVPRRPTLEIAGFIAHKLSRLGYPSEYEAAAADSIFKVLRMAGKCP